MAEKERTNVYLLSIVGIVAVVGIVILLLQSSQPVSWTDEDIAGQATATSCDSDADCAEGYSCASRPSGGYCYEEDEEETHSGSVSGGSAEYDWYDVFGEISGWSGNCRIWEPEEYQWVKDFYRGKSSEAKNVYNCGDNNLYFQTPGLEEKSYAVWADNSKFRPSKAIWVYADVTIEEGYENDHAVIMSKLTTKCGYPLYSLTIEDGKFHFIISIDGTKYEVDGEDVTEGSLGLVDGWYDTQVEAEYKNGWIKIYDDLGNVVDSQYMPGTIKSNYAASNFVLGRSTVCDDFQFTGAITQLTINGANDYE